MPIHLAAGGCTNSGCYHHLLCLRCDGSTNVLAIQDPLEVCSLSGRVIFKLLSASLQPGVRFLQLPLPASPTVPLASPLPSVGRKDGLTTFRINDREVLGADSNPVEQRSRSTKFRDRILSTCLLATAYQHLWQFVRHKSYVDSHVFTIPPSLASYRIMLAVLVTLTGSSYPFGRSTLSEQLHTEPLPVPHVHLGYDGRNRRFYQVASWRLKVEQLLIRLRVDGTDVRCRPADRHRPPPQTGL